MNYFDYLRLCNLEDNQANFIAFLVDIMGRTEEEAKEESKIYYKEESKEV